MGRYFFRRFTLIVFCNIATLATAQVSSAYVQWQDGLLVFSISTEISEGPDAPQMAYIARQQLSSLIPSLFTKSISSLIIDSLYSLQDHYLRQPDLLHIVSELSKNFDERFSHLSTDASSFQQEFTLPLYENLLPLFVNASKETRSPRIPVWVPEESFSGLVIYAAEALPSYGTSRKELLQPALLPEVYSPDIELIHGYRYMDPESLYRWGVTAYTTSTEETAWIPRIGLRPLRITARGIFGKNPSDLIISQEATQMILHSPSLLTALSEGRVLIIAPSESPFYDDEDKL